MSGAAEQLRGARVLLVDDEFDTRFVTRLVLEDAGLLVTEACNGEEALELLEGRLPDAIVTDLDMPGMDGPALIERLRGQPRTADIPILAWGERVRQGLPVNAVLHKGAGIRLLVDEVEGLLRRAE